MQIAICDDSIKDATYLQRLCRTADQLRTFNIDIYTDSMAFFNALERDVAIYDLVFLDIDMPQIDGIHLGKYLAEHSPNTIIVFTTSYPQYAIQAFDCNAFHYVLKPCSPEKIQEIIKRVTLKYKQIHQYFAVKYRNQTYRIPIKDIYYIECCRKHIIYHLKDRTIETIDKLGRVLSELESLGFYQVHQGYIVNFDKVYDFKDYSIILDDQSKVMMSVRKKKEVMMAYTKYAERFL